MVPYTFKLVLPVIFNVAPEFTVRLYTLAVEEIEGELGVPDAITAETLLVGTPADQFPAVAQFVLTEPFQVVVGTPVIPKFKLFDETIAEVAHAALEVRSHVIASLLAKPTPVQVLVFAPDIGLPFLFHWYEGVEPPFVIELE
jgi:hypothetical protein